MPCLRFAATLASAVALLAGTLSRADAQTVPDFSAVDALIQDSLALIGGGAVVRVVRADTVVFERAYGTFATGEAVEIASATKWMSGAVVLSLVDSGHLSLDDPLSRFFPDLTGPKRAITVRQLFSHTSGIVEVPVGSCLTERTTTLAACAAEVLARPLRFTPGTGFFYAGGSMHVAGRVAEIASGRPWATLFAERVARPLGMTDTAYLSATNPWIGGGLVSTAADYTALLQMVLTGGLHRGQRVLSEASVAAMLADQTGVEAGATPVLFSPFSRYAGTDPDLPADVLGYGIGVWREQLTEAGGLRHASSPGAYGFSPWVDVERRLAGALVVLDDGPDVLPTYLELKRRLAAALDGAVTASESGPASPTPVSVRPLFPNPAAGDATVPFRLAASGQVRLEAFDALGRRVAVLVDAVLPAGDHAATVDTRALPAGVYVLRLTAGHDTVTARLTTAR
ncbi:MAG TPA: serine hydrolase [Rubricoccaceae bacterium]